MTIETRSAEVTHLSDDEIAARLREAGVPVKPDRATKNNVGYLAKVHADMVGTYWQMARNVYLHMVETGQI